MLFIVEQVNIKRYTYFEALYMYKRFCRKSNNQLIVLINWKSYTCSYYVQFQQKLLICVW